MTAWRKHRGGGCPTHPEALVLLRFRGGRESLVEQRAGAFDWRDRGQDFDIVGYRVVAVPEEEGRA